jgi:hypothetical protein
MMNYVVSGMFEREKFGIETWMDWVQEGSTSGHIIMLLLSISLLRLLRLIDLFHSGVLGWDGGKLPDGEWG